MEFVIHLGFAHEWGFRLTEKTKDGWPGIPAVILTLDMIDLPYSKKLSSFNPATQSQSYVCATKVISKKKFDHIYLLHPPSFLMTIHRYFESVPIIIVTFFLSQGWSLLHPPVFLNPFSLIFSRASSIKYTLSFIFLRA